MPRNIHPVTGCRPDQLFGEWAIDPEVHQRLVDLCVDLPLEKVLAMGGDMNERQQPVKLYETHGRVGVVRLSGPLTKQPTSFDPVVGGGSTVRARQAIRTAAADPTIDRILVSLESPGGTVAGTQDLFDHMRKVDRNEKPVYTHVNDVGGSAAYWIATAGRRLTANASAMIGSIGAFTVLRDTSGRQEKSGIKLHVVSSGKFKGAGAEGTPITPEALKEVQNRIDSIADLFVNNVADARKMDVAKVREIADGRVFIAAKAKELGLIDAVSSEEDVVAELNRKSPESRNSRMYTAEQLVQARSLPGAAQATEENADVLVLSSAIELKRQNDTIRQELATTRASLPPAYPPELLQGFADIALGKADLKVDQGKMLPAQREAFKAMIFNGDKPRADMLCAANGQKAPYEGFLAMFDLNKPNGLTQEKTPGQPAPKTEPGSAQATTNSSDQIPSFERWNALREKSGLKLFTMEEYKAYFNLP